jgi:hypothetical protein
MMLLGYAGYRAQRCAGFVGMRHENSTEAGEPVPRTL